MASGTTINQMIDVVTPAAGESVTEGTILEWHVKVGDFIKVDDTIVEISTDKVDVELPSPASGTVVEILAEEGDTVGVGQVIARLAEGDGGSAQPSSGDGASSRRHAQDGGNAHRASYNKLDTGEHRHRPNRHKRFARHRHPASDRRRGGDTV